MKPAFGHINVSRNKVRAALDSDLIADHFVDFFTNFVRIESSHSVNGRQKKARQCGLARAMARSLVNGSAQSITREDMVDRIALLQTAFDDEMTELHDAVLTGDLPIKNELKRWGQE